MINEKQTSIVYFYHVNSPSNQVRIVFTIHGEKHVKQMRQFIESEIVNTMVGLRFHPTNIKRHNKNIIRLWEQFI